MTVVSRGRGELAWLSLATLQGVAGERGAEVIDWPADRGDGRAIAKPSLPERDRVPRPVGRSLSGDVAASEDVRALALPSHWGHVAPPPRTP
ncbi:MAG: hypothetical protein AAFV54_05585, partial [Pseudomonadota bacterium]